jgi:7-carboxy-7-deazaguanine synthase
MQLKVNEIFFSVQGESVYAGLPCIFVRLTGCNLRCRYCDTPYAYHAGRSITVGELVAQVRKYDCDLVCITGGEPLAQAATPLLVERLTGDGYRVLVETNGSLDIDRVDRRCSRVMDIKCPSSGEADRNDWGNLERLTPHDQVKFVIGDRDDFCFARDARNRLPDTFPGDRVLFSPQFDRLPPDRLARWMLRERMAARLQLQLHKLIWPDRDRGV